MILAGVHVTHRSSAEPGVGLAGRRTGRRVRVARRGRCPERSPEGHRARPRSAARRDCRIASQAPRQACDRRARCGHRSADVPRRPVGRCPGARGFDDCGARRRRGSTRSAFSPRGDRDDAVPADVRRRAELPRHRQGGRNRGRDGARLGVRLPRVDAVARATAAQPRESSSAAGEADTRIRRPPWCRRRDRGGDRLHSGSRARRLGMRGRPARHAPQRGHAAASQRGQDPRRRSRRPGGERASSGSTRLRWCTAWRSSR